MLELETSIDNHGFSIMRHSTMHHCCTHCYVSIDPRSTMCRPCSCKVNLKPAKAKITWDNETLAALVDECGIARVAKELKVSVTAIRKRLKSIGTIT